MTFAPFSLFFTHQKKFWTQAQPKEKNQVYWKTAVSAMASVVVLDLFTRAGDSSWESDLHKVSFTAVLIKGTDALEKAVVANFALYVLKNIVKNGISLRYIPPLVTVVTFLYQSTLIGSNY